MDTNSHASAEVQNNLTRILGIIPARFASTRFPGKPLIDINGKSMIQRVYERALQSLKLDEVVVATDDERILVHVNDFGGRAILTSQAHQSGTDRCAEAADKLPGFDIIINIQGDEPYIDSRQIDLLASCFADSETKLATLVKNITTAEELNNPNSPKVVLNKNYEALYFSRAAIPYMRGKGNEDWVNEHTFYKHIGIYGYRRDTLQAITKLPVSLLEKAESLEQLRWIENGYKIKVAVTDIETKAIDTPADLENILKDSGQGL
ncbi:3-deoxy-manno-octulosonate cytidylyltransferase (CMP-KDO synthetase) [Arcticibacter tournemirensis]|uniref:3-deoxy-manno-octulosonate cytidylyltransferase n=1 Tax=Arcticibacter tournemirensis TaxID=699437 RepID=A0A5M9H9N1_9SPHI|nr:3-deoxy-manno-octulosonate cytidylyltransferase [Arcticibacter tournemirensis]KAA8483632.1 3-deoxy-manno-octulosonate cytidylyltransferase [Arcticibacter tournemirensis]TQM51414.1 3-deoxy-manno-octulosonate cytidylyltransferase (CMP-KDO synthetase) [Arcticibacter tournemirensis]